MEFRLHNSAAYHFIDLPIMQLIPLAFNILFTVTAALFERQADICKSKAIAGQSCQPVMPGPTGAQPEICGKNDPRNVVSLIRRRLMCT